jgi:List-Bact-rpt repeat protein
VTATFTSAKAALLTPTPASTLTGPSVTFTWSAGTGAAEYRFYVGTTLGGTDVYVGNTLGLSLTTTVNTLPTTGIPLFARLYTRFGTTWLFTDYTFTAVQQFTLSVVGAGDGSGTVSPVAAGRSAPFTAGTSVTLTATPAIGSTFTGWTGGGCTGTAACPVTMTAATTVTATFTSAKAALLTPTPASTLTGPSVTFTWSAGTGAAEYRFYVGTTLGGTDVYVGNTLGLSLTTTVNTLPRGGIPLFARLYTRFGTTWLFTDYTFTAAP